MCFVILWLSVSLLDWSFVWYCECLYECGSVLFWDVSVCTKVTVPRILSLCVRAPIWQSSVVWYCESVYQFGTTPVVCYCECCGTALFCDTVSVLQICSALFCITDFTCSIVTMLLYLILWIPVSMWLCFVVRYCEYLYQCGSAYSLYFTFTLLIISNLHVQPTLRIIFLLHALPMYRHYSLHYSLVTKPS